MSVQEKKMCVCCKTNTVTKGLLCHSCVEKEMYGFSNFHEKQEEDAMGFNTFQGGTLEECADSLSEGERISMGGDMRQLDQEGIYSDTEEPVAPEIASFNHFVPAIDLQNNKGMLDVHLASGEGIPVYNDGTKPWVYETHMHRIQTETWPVEV